MAVGRAVCGVTTLVLLAGCSVWPTGLGETADHEGLYGLVSVDGVGLPFALQPGVTCGAVISDGQLSFSGPAAGGRRPRYAVTVVSRTGCEQSSTRPALATFTQTTGEWRERGGEPSLTSGGARLVDVTASGGAQELVVEIAARRYVFRRVSNPGEALASVRVAVVDASGRPVPQAFVELRARNGYVLRFLSTEAAIAPVALAPGPLSVRVAPPPGYRLVGADGDPRELILGPQAVELVFVVALAP
jgi:hypothetical protein